MSPALSDLPIRKIITIIESLGFVHVRTKGSHAVHQHPDGRAVVIPQHGTIKRGTLGSILRQAGITPVHARNRDSMKHRTKTAANQPRHTPTGALPTARFTVATPAVAPRTRVIKPLATSSISIRK